MAGRRMVCTEASIAGKIKAGRGCGTGINYLPWFNIHDFPSKGIVSRVLGLKTARIHHFLSTLETSLFYILDWSDSVTDIREQFPLDRKETAAIAEALGYRHPSDPVSRVPIVMTTDILATIETENRISYRAYSVKPFAELSRPRVKEKLLIEKEFWQSKDVPWQIVTQKQLPSQLIFNLKHLRRYIRIQDLGIESNELEIMKRRLISNMENNVKPLLKLLNELDKETGRAEGQFLKIFYHLASIKTLRINPNDKIDLNKPAEEYLRDSHHEISIGLAV